MKIKILIGIIGLFILVGCMDKEVHKEDAVSDVQTEIISDDIISQVPLLDLGVIEYIEYPYNYFDYGVKAFYDTKEVYQKTMDDLINEYIIYDKEGRTKEFEDYIKTYVVDNKLKKYGIGFDKKTREDDLYFFVQSFYLTEDIKFYAVITSGIYRDNYEKYLFYIKADNDQEKKLIHEEFKEKGYEPYQIDENTYFIESYHYSVDEINKFTSLAKVKDNYIDLQRLIKNDDTQGMLEEFEIETLSHINENEIWLSSVLYDDEVEENDRAGTWIAYLYVKDGVYPTTINRDEYPIIISENWYAGVIEEFLDAERIE